jgi:hypothetical protein
VNKLILAIVLACGVASAQPSGSSYQLPTMSEMPRGTLPPIDVARPAPAPDRRPVFVGAGIVLLAGLFWWNTRRRARLAEEDQDER